MSSTSISDELLEAAIEWAKQFTDISDEQKKIIMESKKYSQMGPLG